MTVLDEGYLRMIECTVEELEKRDKRWITSNDQMIVDLFREYQKLIKERR